MRDADDEDEDKDDKDELGRSAAGTRCAYSNHDDGRCS